MPRRLGPTTLLRSEVEVPVTGFVSLLGYWGEHAGHSAQTVGNTVQSGGVFRVEDYTALAGLVVFEDAADLLGDVCELHSDVAVTKPYHASG
jgi:hypothetical protein